MSVFADSTRTCEHWEHCRNSLSIARLLVQEQRPEALVSTACRMAVENACRAALEQVGLTFDGDLDRSLDDVLSVPASTLSAGSAADRLAAAQRMIESISSYLRHTAPDRSWGF